MGKLAQIEEIINFKGLIDFSMHSILDKNKIVRWLELKDKEDDIQVKYLYLLPNVWPIYIQQ